MEKNDKAFQKDELQKAISISRNVELIDIRFIQMNAEITGFQSPAFEEIKLDVECIHASPVTTTPKSEGDNFFSIVLAFKLKGIIKEQDDPFIQIEAHIGALYKLNKSKKDEYSQDDYKCFAFINGRLNLWPYWREFVQTTSTRLGLQPPIIIPVFRIISQPGLGSGEKKK